MHALRRFLNWLTPGTRCFLGAWIIGFALSFSPIVPLLTLAAPAVWHGQVWRVVSYGCLPNGFVDFLLTAIALTVLGVVLERRWPARTLIVYALFVVVATGLTWALFSGDSRARAGGGPLFFGLLVAWGRVCGDETVFLAPSLPMSAMKAALLFGGISLLATTLTIGWRNAAFAGLGAVWGFIYLGVRTKLGESANVGAPAAQRISRLEL